jgi:hypothetical protein
MNDIRELTDAELDIVGGGHHHNSGGSNTLNVAINVDSTIGNQVVGTQNNFLSAVGNIFGYLPV